MEVDSEEDEWPEQDGERGRQGSLCATEVREVVVRVGNEQARYDIDDENHLAK
jgi:hypothetical protein